MLINKGDLLISYPYLEDDYFIRSVICLMEHNIEGSFGLIVNKKMPYNIGDLVPMLSKLRNPIYMGGPVETQNLFFLHPYKDLKDTIQINEDLFWNGDLNELKDMVELDFAVEDEIKFFLGYSGWGSGQLIEEINEKSWLIGDFSKTIIYDKSTDEVIWRKSIEMLGRDFRDIAQYPMDPQMN